MVQGDMYVIHEVEFFLLMDKSSNTGERERSMRSHSRFSMEPTKEEGPSSVQQISSPIVSTWLC